MNWDSIGAVGEVIGALAVVVSIVYLASQIRANTKAVRANAGFEATHSWANFNEIAAGMPDEHLSLLMRTFDPNENWETFSDIERTRIAVMMRALFQKLEGQYYLYQYEQLDKGLWANRSTFAAGLLELPYYKKWWGIEKQQLVYSQDFISAIEAIEGIPINQELLGGKNATT